VEKLGGKVGEFNIIGAMGWIKEGLGEKVAFIAAHLYWINWIIDTALYPVLITDYIKTISEKHLDNWVCCIISVMISFAKILINRK
jgi:L-asparagine transporter-like permease